jgi:hypothetical protein
MQTHTSSSKAVQEVGKELQNVYASVRFRPPRLQSSSHYKQTASALHLVIPLAEPRLTVSHRCAEASRLVTTWKRTFRRRSPTQQRLYRSIGRILNTCPKTRFRYVTATISECGQSRPRFRPSSFSNVHRRTVSAITDDGTGISICCQTWRPFRKKSIRTAAS